LKKTLIIFFTSILITFLAFSLARRFLIKPDRDSSSTPIDGIFSEWDNPDSPGVAVAVIKNGSIVVSKGFGSANLEYSIPITPSTIFHVASVSKQFTAFAITLLAEQGKLSLDDDIHAHLPWVPDFGKKITIRNLIHHTSGLRDQWELFAMGGGRLDDVITQDNIFKMVKREKDLNFNPGEEYLYCNTGYSLLAEIVSTASGLPFSAWTKDNIFKSLEMTNTHFHEDHEMIVKNRAYSYSSLDGGGYRKRVLSFANVGATSLFTTAEDLAKWLLNFENQRIGSRAVIEQMHKQGELNDGSLIDYAFALNIGDHKGLKTVSHSGSDAGFRSFVIRFPEQRFGIVILSNLSSINPSRLAAQVADEYLKKAFIKEAPEKEAPETEEAQIYHEIFDAYIGTYQLQPWRLITISKQNDSLTAQLTGAAKQELIALSDTRFLIKDRDVQIIFNLNNVGQANTLTYSQNGEETQAEKILPVRLSIDQMGEYVGDYYSDELDASYSIGISKGGLAASHRRHEDIPLEVITKDYFSGQQWFFRRVHFIRDENDRVTGFLLTGRRVRNLKFNRKRPLTGLSY
jgi:CubicO group peptidase (beta-lactamase class C family)